MDILTAKIGANMAKKELAASGQVGYVKSHQALILPETEIVFTSYIELPKIGLINMISGVEYITKWDGEEYRCTAIQDGVMATIGNLNIINNTAPDTGEPFVVATDSDEGCTYVIPSEFGTYTISISGGFETIHTIDPKFLPGNIPRVVNLIDYGVTAENLVNASLGIRQTIESTAEQVAELREHLHNCATLIFKVSEGSFMEIRRTTTISASVDGEDFLAILDAPIGDNLAMVRLVLGGTADTIIISKEGT